MNKSLLKTEKHRFTSLLYYLLGCFILLAVFLIVFPAWFGTFHYFIDIFTHFRLQLAIVGILSGLLQLLFLDYKKYYRNKLLFPLLSLLIILLFFPYNIHFRQGTTQNGDIYYINMNLRNEYPEVLVEQIESTQATTVAVVELTPEMTSKLSILYPYQITTNAPEYSDNCGIFSKTEPNSTEIKSLTYNICITEFPTYTLIAVHPLPPLSPETWEMQKQHFNEIKEIYNTYQKAGKNPIIVGDFNSTQYSPIYKEYFNEFNEPVIYTWNKRSLLTLPIDHALSNLPIEVTPLNALSSDHVGLLITLP